MRKLVNNLSWTISDQRDNWLRIYADNCALSRSVQIKWWNNENTYFCSNYNEQQMIMANTSGHGKPSISIVIALWIPATTTWRGEVAVHHQALLSVLSSEKHTSVVNYLSEKPIIPITMKWWFRIKIKFIAYKPPRWVLCRLHRYCSKGVLSHVYRILKIWYTCFTTSTNKGKNNTQTSKTYLLSNNTPLNNVPSTPTCSLWQLTWNI